MKDRIISTTLAMAALALVGTALPQDAQAKTFYKTRTFTRTIETPVMMQKAIEAPVLTERTLSAPVLTDSCTSLPVVKETCAPVLMEKCVQSPVLLERTLSTPVIIEDDRHLFDFSIKRLLHVGLF
jgi:hypothetical protein